MNRLRWLPILALLAAIAGVIVAALGDFEHRGPLAISLGLLAVTAALLALGES